MHSYATRSKTNKMKNRLNCLPRDLLVEILKLLPAKDLLRLSMVCKLLNSIISQPSFHHHHLQQLRKNNNHGCKYYISSYFSGCFRSVDIRSSETFATIEEIKLCSKPHYDHGMNTIMGCVDGVLLAGTISLHSDNVIFLWNPTFRKVVDIPLYGKLKKINYSYNVGFGFGFDSASNNYKVVAIYLEKNDLKTMVYNLVSRSWSLSKVHNGLIDNVKYLSQTPRSLNFEGCIYWLARVEKAVIYMTHCLCFNLSTEALACTKLPDDKCNKVGYASRRHLAVLYESLALVDDSNDGHGGTHVRVWMRRKDRRTNCGFSWTELYNLDFEAKSFINLTNDGKLYLQSRTDIDGTVSVHDLKAGKEKDCSSKPSWKISFMDGYIGSLALYC